VNGSRQFKVRENKYIIMKPSLEEKIQKKILILDGAMGTMIQKHRLQEADYRGEKFRDHPLSQKGNNDLLTLTNPAIISDIHLKYLEAGADIITTNTFNANRISMADYGMESQVRELNFEGDFALAYVIAHEVGHHIQNQLGIMEEVSSLQQRSSQTRSNALSVRLELQADFLAGVWAHYARRTQGFIDSADIEEGLNAASAVGDDRIMKRQQGYVVPDGFTHGTSAQRVRWFRKGLDTGDVEQGDTFNTDQL